MTVIGEIPKDYDAKAFEKEIFEFWEKENVPESTRLKGNEKYYFLDGPPYVTNPIHVGTAWNKSLKDAYIRYFKMRGYMVRDQPGFDMHGLPIEVMVEKKLGIKTKKEIEALGIENFVNACKSFALENLKVATSQFQNLGVWMDWESPYQTLDNSYIESVWWLIKKAHEKGLLEKGNKIVHWCPRCETVLAGYEATDEYREVEEDSIYVKFSLEGKEDEYIVIWTTTPWTLPANVAVMVNPDFMYARVKVGGEIYIVAEDRVRTVFGDEKYEIVERVPGSELSGLRYVPPLLEEVPKQKDLTPAHFVVLSDLYVTLEEGTGCVHTAPGHGEEDHEVGEIYGLPDFCPVDERGKFTEDGGKYAGRDVRESNKEIIEDLRKKGLLLKVETTRHRYPHCWRCKTPLILRLATQWFIKVTEIKERMLEENEKVEWVPEWAGKSRFGNWIKNAKDWVISRQRYWGVPLPIWVCWKCGNHDVIGSLSELRSRATQIIGEIDLHRPWVDYVKIKCKCGHEMERVSDVADVWMDSGSASFASLHYPSNVEEWGRWWPVDMILEGHDQTRGWFYTLMVCGIIAFNSAPYRRVLMHGFTIDQDGRAMHKSLGNVVYPEEVIEKYSRDTLRWYVLGCTTWEDLKFTWKTVEETSRFIGILWSTYYFASLYMSLDKFSPDRHTLSEASGMLKEEDRWVLSRLERLIGVVTDAMSGLRVFEAVRELEYFMKEELSRWYIKLIRKRTWTETEDPEKIAAYVTLYEVLFNYLKMIAPMIPFVSEKIYQGMFKGGSGEPLSVHMLGWPVVEKRWRDEELEEDMQIIKEIIEASYSARQSAKIKTRQPLMRLRLVSDEDRVIRAVSRLRRIVLEQANVKEVEVISPEEEEKMKEIRLLANPAVIGPVFRGKSKMVSELISSMNGRDVLRSMRDGRPVFFEVDGEKFELKKEYIIVQESVPENYKGAACRFGTVYIDTTKDKDLIAQGLMRDIIRRVQEMRKIAALRVDAYINVWIGVPSEEIRGLVSSKMREISTEVRAKGLDVSVGEIPKVAFREAWEIDGEGFVIGIEEEGHRAGS